MKPSSLNISHTRSPTSAGNSWPSLEIVTGLFSFSEFESIRISLNGRLHWLIHSTSNLMVPACSSTSDSCTKSSWYNVDQGRFCCKFAILVWIWATPVRISSAEFLTSTLMSNNRFASHDSRIDHRSRRRFETISSRKPYGATSERKPHDPSIALEMPGLIYWYNKRDVSRQLVSLAEVLLIVRLQKISNEFCYI